MSSLVRAWVRFLVGVMALALVTICAREAKAYPGLLNVNGTAGSGYVTSGMVDAGLAGCIQCHGDFSSGSATQPWSVTSLTPALTISGTGTGTSHGTNSDGNGGIFTVQPGALATFHLTFKTLTGAGGSGGFLVYHTDGTNNSSGTLIPVGSEHACKEDVADPLLTCGGFSPSEIPGNNTELSHSVPQVTGNGNLAFDFQYQAPAVCSGTFNFRLWFNAENGDSNCGTPDSSYLITFQVTIASCNDGNACTSNLCIGGVCTFPTAVTCSASDQCHDVGTCNTSTGVCSNPAKGNGSGCNDGNACTQSDTCQSGVCTGASPVVCTASDQCHTAGTCDTSNGTCSNPTKGNGTGCNDGNACTQSDTCQGGNCTGANPVVCTASDQCHNAGTCNTSTGTCSNPAVSNNTPCDDGNSCTTGDTCQSGVCQSGAGITCPAPDQCHTAVACSGGVCPVLPPKSNGTPCNDGNACTNGDTCQSGVCTAGPALNCNDNKSCSTDSCIPSGPGAGCSHVAVAGGTQCSPPSCTASVATPAENCDGTSFDCPTATPVSCGGAICSGTACSGGCNGDDTLCTTGNFCLANVCTPKLGNGSTCNGDNYCANGHCVDGVCCNSACGGGDSTDCQVCNLPTSKGTCTNPVGTVCRPANPSNDCDAAERCVAGNPLCPTDLPVPASANQVCRASSDGNLCDPAETCDGVGFNCPANTATRNGVVCRRSAGACDPAESCSGNACPPDVLDTTSVCRPNAAGTNCDVPEVCGSNGANCPTDSFKANNISCRTAACSSGTATVPANCPGNAASCPTLVTKDCTPYVCQGTACGTTCNAKTDCDVGFYCNPQKQCVPELPAGAPCSAPESCGTGICVDGYCCNTQCTGQCQACDVPNKLGVCSPVPATDKVPHGARPKCTGDATVCHGVCDGTTTASCTFPSGNQCVAPTCTSGVATPEEKCNGTGTCPSQPDVTCAPGICQAATGPKAVCVGGGGVPCVADVECSAGNYCNVTAGKCVPKVTDGGSCVASSQCANGHCVDGLCCDSSCDGQCEACDVTGKKGVCSPIPSGETPHKPRALCASDSQFPACAGQCDGKNRLACVYPGGGTLCRDASCTNDIATLPAYCTGTGTCSPAQEQACDPGAGNGCNKAGTLCSNGCTADRDCSIGKYCAGGVCVPTVPQGQPCSASSQCSGACVDGVCCNTTCDHQCEACNVPGKLGICTAVNGAPVLPRPSCATDGTPACAGKCNGVNHDACTYPGSTVQCAAGSCGTGVATLTDYCDGSGSCPPAEHQICAPADCSGTKCGGDCAGTGVCPSGEFCSAGVCITKLPPKAACNQDSECGNGICTDGYCCNSACAGQCQACDVPGSEGVCTTLVGDLPHGGRAACPGFGACAATCDGSSATSCTYAGPTTTCGKSSCASDGEQLAAPLCNGNGACLPAAAKSCGAYTCDPGSGTCPTNCILPSDCAVGFDCVNAKCVVTTDGGVPDSGAAGAPDMPDGSTTTDAGDDAMATDAGTDAATDAGTDAGNGGTGGQTDGGLVPPNHATDKGSCGCTVPGSDNAPSNVLLFASALGLLGIVARRRRSGGRRAGGSRIS